MKVTSDISSTQTALDALRKKGRIALVTTMGNLHAGHLTLIKAAQALADTVVVSLFVNPAQFAPHEDYASYPRTLEADLQALRRLQVDLVFTPQASDIYPHGTEAHTHVRVPQVSEGLCSLTRPHFFQGVTTVVCALFNIVRPDIAVFGEKDYQQLRCVQKMVKDLQMPITVIGVPTQREQDGLALSSRNQYLSSAERQKAPQLYQTLQALVSKIKTQQDSVSVLIQQAKDQLHTHGFKTDYLEVRTQETLSVPQNEKALVLLVAAYLGSTRLIDNISFVLN